MQGVSCRSKIMIDEVGGGSVEDDLWLERR
jgi:hypothetical protein